MEITMYKKDLKDQDNHGGVVTHLEPDILECEVRCALGSTAANKASRGGRIPAELFKILKDHAIKELHSICQQIWKTQQWPQDWKTSIFIPVPKKGSPKECSNYWKSIYVGQEATVRTLYGTTDWFQIEKGVLQGCLLSLCLFNLYTEYIIQNARQDELQAGIKISWRNINNLRYADDNSSSPAFLMMCSTHRLNKQSDSKKPCRTSFSILNQSVVPYRVLTVAS